MTPAQSVTALQPENPCITDSPEQVWVPTCQPRETLGPAHKQPNPALRQGIVFGVFKFLCLGVEAHEGWVASPDGGLYQGCRAGGPLARVHPQALPCYTEPRSPVLP